MQKSLCLASVVCVLALAFSRPTYAQSATYVGDDLGDPRWRTPSVAKPLDPDGDNIYGTAGYAVLDSSTGDHISNPSGVTVTRLTTGRFPGNSGYVQIDNPAGYGVLTSGIWYNSVSHNGQVDLFAALTFTASENYVVGIFTDNTDFQYISPINLRIQQVAGVGSADSGFVNSYLDPNRNGDWYFFDVQGDAGDVFDISGTTSAPLNCGSCSDGIGIISFDAAPVTVPEPAAWTLLAIVAVPMLLRRRAVPRRRTDDSIS